SSTAMAFGFMMIPAPTVASLGARSSTTAASPRRSSSRARESPPIPPPTTIVERGIGGPGPRRKTPKRGRARAHAPRGPTRVGRAALEAARRVEDLGQETQIADRVQEDAGHAEHVMHRAVDVGLVLERLIPRGVRAIRGRPRAARDRFDGLHGHVALEADRD